jgi:uncharacterized protein (DUF2461 family)
MDACSITSRSSAGEYHPNSFGAFVRDPDGNNVEADKSPYKLQIYARVSRIEGGGDWYVQLREEGLFVGGGVYAPDRRRLASVRAAIADDRAGTALEEIVAHVREHGLDLMEHGSLKAAP